MANIVPLAPIFNANVLLPVVSSSSHAFTSSVFEGLTPTLQLVALSGIFISLTKLTDVILSLYAVFL